MPETEQTTAEPEAQPEVSFAQRLRDFEDKHFGKDATRIAGQVEKGHGSKHQLAPDDVKAHHAALESAIGAEQALAELRAKLVDAEQALAAATARVEATHDVHEEAEQQRQSEVAEQAA